MTVYSAAQIRPMSHCCTSICLAISLLPQILIQSSTSAYWIAFGPHGPRAQPDPNENFEVLKIILYCLGASALIFGIARYFARDPPKTMNKEWQEMTNEYLKVRLLPSSRAKISRRTYPDHKKHRLTHPRIGSKIRSNHRCIIRGLRRAGHGTEQTTRQEAWRRRRRVDTQC